MKMSGKLGFLLGLVLAVGAGSANASYGYRYGYDPDPYHNSSYDNDHYNNYNDHYSSDRYGGRRVVRCESRDQRTAYCGVDTRGGVRLVDQHSDRRCVRGRTWGSNSRGIWVTDGCRASFEVGDRGRSNDRYGRVFRCESRDSRTAYCSTDTRYGVRMTAQLSRNPCIEGRSWGATRNGVWVSRGCRAEFRVGDRYSNDDYGYRDDYGSRY